MESGELEDLGRWLVVKRQACPLGNQGRLDSIPHPLLQVKLGALDKLDVLCKVSSRAWHKQHALDGSVSLFGAAGASVGAEHLGEARVEYPGAALKDCPQPACKMLLAFLLPPRTPQCHQRVLTRLVTSYTATGEGP